MFTMRKGALAPFVSTHAFLLLVATSAALGADNPKDAVVHPPAATSVRQVTSDGVSKTNLLSDESNLYVTEWPAARHVVARVSLSGANRLVVSNPFPNVQALDISPDRSQLLVSPMQSGGDNEFWTVPVNAGSPKRIGNLTGRDATWSADGQYLVFSKGTKLYIANAEGYGAREIFTANGSVFAPRFSPNGKHVRFTVGNTAQNLTSIWEVSSDGSNPHSVLGTGRDHRVLRRWSAWPQHLSGHAERTDSCPTLWAP
jgi:Tol biopolymer transport system component